jgi:hypothetical protein
MRATMGVSIVPGHGVDADAAGGVLQRCACGQTDYSVLGGVIGGSAGVADEPGQ